MPDAFPSPLRLVVIAGPTATGKSEIAVHAAKALDGEIVNADSVQLYRYFDIGSAKPGPEMRREVPHHLVDLLLPDAHFTLWDYKMAAQGAIRDIVARGKTPILCGGTGLYIKAVVEDLGGGARRDERLRAELSQSSPAALYERLKGLDPARAARLHPNDTYRIIRGIENALLPPKEDREGTVHYDTAYFVVSLPRSIIYERIEARVERMFTAGWITEVKSVLSRGFEARCKPFNSVGYRQIMQFLAGELPEEGLMAEVKRVTRNYAKRQTTWFSAVRGAVQLDALSGVQAAAEKVVLSVTR